MSLLILVSGRGRETVNETFTSNTTWVCPDTTNLLRFVNGEGQDGAPNPPTDHAIVVAEVNYFASGTGSTAGFNTWASFDFLINDALIKFGGGSPATYTHQFSIQYSNTSYSNTNTPTSFTGGIPASAFVTYEGAWIPGGGTISGDGTATMHWQTDNGVSTGANTTGFGYTFPGGGGVPATPIQHADVPVTPGASYNLVIPTGGFITLVYEK